MIDEHMSPRRRLRLARDLFAATEGRSWDPPRPDHPWLAGLVEAGYLRRTENMSGTVRIRNAGVTWTEAAQVAFGRDLVSDAA